MKRKFTGKNNQKFIGFKTTEDFKSLNKQESQMAENTYSNENAIAQIKLIYSPATGVVPVQARQQTAYNTWMAGGGKPDFIESYAPNLGHEFEIIVYRQDLNNPAGQPMRIRAWKGMPLFIGDKIEGGQNLFASVDFLIGGRFWVVTGDVWKLIGVGHATNLNFKPKGVWKKFTENKPFHFNTGAGSTMGTRG